MHEFICQFVVWFEFHFDGDITELTVYIRCAHIQIEGSTIEVRQNLHSHTYPNGLLTQVVAQRSPKHLKDFSSYVDLLYEKKRNEMKS